MAFKFVAAVLLVACASQATAACLVPPPCALSAPAYPPFGLEALLGALAPALPPFAPAFPPCAQNLPLSAYFSAFARPAFSLPPLPAFPYPAPPTSVVNKPDVNIPYPLPAEIPVGKYCTCQKFAIKPALVDYAAPSLQALLSQLPLSSALPALFGGLPPFVPGLPPFVPGLPPFFPSLPPFATSLPPFAPSLPPYGVSPYGPFLPPYSFPAPCNCV